MCSYDSLVPDIRIHTSVLNAKFEEIDTDKDGKLTFDEVREHIAAQVLRRMQQNPTDSEIKEFMDGIDKDGKCICKSLPEVKVRL